MGHKKTFREKLTEEKDLPRIQPLEGGMRMKWGDGTVVMPAPSEVHEIMRRVPRRKLITINQIRDTLAQRHGATIACPIVTGIFARIVAGAAGEDEEDGKKRVTPYWRTLKSKGELNEKYPGGIEGQSARLEKEGHRVVRRGRSVFVEGYERSLVGMEESS